MKQTAVMISIKDFSVISGIGQCTIRNLCKASAIPCMKAGRKYLIHKEKALAWLEKYSIEQMQGGMNSAL